MSLTDYLNERYVTKSRFKSIDFTMKRRNDCEFLEKSIFISYKKKRKREILGQMLVENLFVSVAALV